MMRLLCVLFTAFLLAGCVTANTLGISESQWKATDQSEQKKMIANYRQITHSSNRELASDLMHSPPDDTSVKVVIAGGKVMMPPFAAPSEYKPVSFTLPSGSCQTLKLEQFDNSHSVDMKACYFNKTLYMDPSRYEVSKRKGSIQLHYSPIWSRGFTYHNVSSSGYARLMNADIFLRLLSKDDDVEVELPDPNNELSKASQE